MGALTTEQVRNYEKKIFDLQQLLEISRALNSTLDYHYLIQVMLDMCLAQARTLKVGLFLVPDIDSEELLPVKVAKGFNISDKSDLFKIDLKCPLVLHLAERQLTLNMREMSELFPDEAYTNAFRRLGAELIIGVVFRDKILGIIFVGKKLTGESYSVEERGFFIDLATLSGISVANAYLYKRATTDQMTGLKNYAYFQNALYEECENARKSKEPLAILFADIDRFKNVNDTYGHLAGNFIIKNVAETLQSLIRSNDLVARYGGEGAMRDYALGADQEAALHCAERIRAKVEEKKFTYEDKDLYITISIGVAFFDSEKDCNKEHFIEKADRALYVCKRNGRNQVRLHTPEMGSRESSL